MSGNELLDCTTKDLAARNSPELLASQLQTAIRDKNKAAERHRDDLRAYCKGNEQGIRVYNFVMAAKKAGRKTVRVVDLLEAAEPKL